MSTTIDSMASIDLLTSFQFNNKVNIDLKNGSKNSNGVDGADKSDKVDNQSSVKKNNNQKSEKSEEAENKTDKKSEKTTSGLLNISDNNTNKTVKVFDRVLRFEVKDVQNDDGKVGKQLIISVLDEKTGDVIRKIPPEELKKEVDNFTKTVGIMLDKKI